MSFSRAGVRSSGRKSSLDLLPQGVEEWVEPSSFVAACDCLLIHLWIWRTSGTPEGRSATFGVQVLVLFFPFCVHFLISFLFYFLFAVFCCFFHFLTVGQVKGNAQDGR